MRSYIQPSVAWKSDYLAIAESALVLQYLRGFARLNKSRTISAISPISRGHRRRASLFESPPFVRACLVCFRKGNKGYGKGPKKGE